jgi:ribonuclease P protein component
MEKQRSQGFHKTERLNNKKLIKELFDKGSSFFLYPFKVFYKPAPPNSRTQVLFSIPKRNFKKAVDRNKIKRRLRESYRRNKTILYDKDKNDVSFLIAYIYISKEILSYKEIEDKLKSSLMRLQNVKQ